LALKTTKILYVSGEESAEQIKMRAERIDKDNTNCFVYSETNTQAIFEQVKALQPQLIIIDSIQTLYSNLILSSAGSVSQVRECAGEFQRLAKETNIPVVLIGHINKDGELAGPKILEHIVDVVLQFEGDRNYTYRLLRTIKNRFGSAMELGVYEMKGYGLKPVLNPSEILMSQRDEALSGITIAATIEGLRPLMIETQALVASAVYGNPQRSATGFDIRRLNMLLAVLEKRAGFALASKDVFLNIAGGIKISDPAIDLSVITSVMSSYEDTEVSSKIAFCAEVGLSGEIRAINRIEQRISEADKLGFEKIFISKYNQKIDARNYQIEIVEVGKVLEVFNRLF
jgi:DNA repair protein RadA/Sms